VGRTDDSAHVCARDGGSGEGVKALTQKGNTVRRAPGSKRPAPLAVAEVRQLAPPAPRLHLGTYWYKLGICLEQEGGDDGPQYVRVPRGPFHYVH